MAKRYFSTEQNAAASSDGGMLHNDESAIGCLPQNVVMKGYSTGVGHMYMDIPDTLTAINKQMAADGAAMAKGTKPRKT
jgi:hypothetical protein